MEAESAQRAQLRVCPECDLVCTSREAAPKERGLCPRCHACVHREPMASMHTALALACTACVLFLILNAFPLLSLTLHDTRRDATLIQAGLRMWDHGMQLVALLVLWTTVLAPAAQVLIHLVVLLKLRSGRAWSQLQRPLRWLHRVGSWSMGEVFLMGLLVSMVKLQHVADLVPGPAFWACLGLIFVTAALNGMVTPRSVWFWYASVRPSDPQYSGAVVYVDSFSAARPHAGEPLGLGCGLGSSSGWSMGWAVCSVCAMQSQLPAPLSQAALSCGRCQSKVQARRPDSQARTTALLIAATVLYIPANLLPMMHTQSIWESTSDTILSGVMSLLSSGSWPLALVVFVASMVVPLLKILTLSLLVWTTARHSRWAPLQRHRLYRAIELMGRWSMLDIFVITVLVGVVQFQGLAAVVPGSAALAFTAVVVLTLCAAQSFDPRLMWDRALSPPPNPLAGSLTMEHTEASTAVEAIKKP